MGRKPLDDDEAGIRRTFVLSAQHVADIDRWAKRRGVNHSKALRQIIDKAMGREPERRSRTT